MFGTYILDHLTNYHVLYSKNVQDAIWIYIIEHNKWNPDLGQSIKETFVEYHERFLDLQKKYNEERQDVQKYNTPNMLTALKTRESFDDIMLELIPNLVDGYQKLISYIDYVIKTSGLEISTFYYTDNPTNKAQIYYRNLRNLKKKQVIPSREFLIVLGLQLELSSEGIGKLLNYAGMIPLYSKNILEGKILYHLEELYSKYPSIFFDYDKEDEDLYIEKSDWDMEVK
jgi:hypothetical protein